MLCFEPQLFSFFDMEKCLQSLVIKSVDTLGAFLTRRRIKQNHWGY